MGLQDKVKIIQKVEKDSWKIGEEKRITSSLEEVG